jgi:glyoxylase-like metal-dependent hydrolase (beta-lactamase superfamily II)
VRRTILGAAVVVVALLALPVVVAAGGAFLGLAPIVDGEAVADGVVAVQDGYVSLHVVDVAPGRVLLVDCGQGAEAVRAHLASRGLGDEAVAAILLTHGHADHVGGCAAFPDAVVHALGAERDLVEGRVAARGPLTRLAGARDHGVRVDRVVADGEVLRIGDVDVEAFAVPGHTAGSAAWLVRDVVFVGDSASVEDDGDLRPAPWAFTDDPAENRAALTRLANRLRDRAVARVAASHTSSAPPGALAGWRSR